MIEAQKNSNENEYEVKVENEFLKLKLMAEYGGQFYPGNAQEDVPAEIENQFLNNVVEFERQFASRRTITVFEKIGSPRHFKPGREIIEEEMEQAWRELSGYMSEHGVYLSACSPRVDARELYRFATEELFKHETDDINIPGMITGFIYDEFYPDHEYDNRRTAVHNCVQAIFTKDPLEWMHQFSNELRFNNHGTLTRDDFKGIINRYKQVHDEIELDSVNVELGKLADKLCVIQGNYSAHAKIEKDVAEYKGSWLVEFMLDDDSGYWHIKNVQLEGVAF